MRQTRRRKKRPMCRWRTGDCLDETGKKPKRCFPWFWMGATVEDAPGLAPGNPHGHPFRNDCPDDVPNRCSLQVGKQGVSIGASRQARFPAPGVLEMFVLRETGIFSRLPARSPRRAAVRRPPLAARGSSRSWPRRGALAAGRGLERPGAFQGLFSPDCRTRSQR